MKKFITKIVIFAALVAIADTGLGYVFRFLIDNAKGGGTERESYICKKTNEDLLIFGSSRAIHHYVPTMLEDSLGTSVYNCGLNGNGIILFYGWYRMAREHYTPKVVLYEVTPAFDISPNDNTKYFGQLRRFYDFPPVDSIFWEVAPTERYKMLAQTYRYNSTFLQLAINFVSTRYSGEKGYLPLLGTMSYEPKPYEEAELPIPTDSLKMYYLERLINDCRADGTRLVFLASPLYGATESRVFTPVKELCARYDVPFIDHYADPAFRLTKKYFKDSSHLNQTGAEAYTRCIIQELRPLLAD